MKQLYANNASTYLVQALGGNVGDLSLRIVAADANLFPTPVLNEEYFLVTLENVTTKQYEIVRVRERVGDTLNLAVRGEEGTNIYPFPIGSKVQLRVTRDTLNNIRTAAEAAAAGLVVNVASPLTVWTLTHNLNRYPSVTIQEEYGSGQFRTVEGDVDYVSANQLTVTFSEAIKGKAFLN